MRMSRVEVVVRFAGDLLDVVQVEADSTYWIGMTPVVARPGREVVIGHVTVTMAAADGQRPVPRRAIEQRPYIYGGASLLAHLAVVATALWTVTPEPLSVPAIETYGKKQAGAARIKRFATTPQTIKQTPDPAPSETPVTTDHTPDQDVERDTPPPQLATEFTPSEIAGGGLTNAAPKDGDGTSRFDPASDPAFDTVKVGDYSTVASGRTAGEHYGAHARNSNLVVITCDRASCLVLGGEKATRVRKAVNERMAELTDCYKQAAESGGGKVEIDFDVDGAGAVSDLDITEADPAGTCVARILRTMKIDEA
jgi:hypothetical protein